MRACSRLPREQLGRWSLPSNSSRNLRDRDRHGAPLRPQPRRPYYGRLSAEQLAVYGDAARELLAGIISEYSLDVRAAPLLSLRVPCRRVALFPRELAKILDQLRRLRDPNRPRALDAIEAALLAIGLAELAERQQQTIDELRKKLWQTQQELAHYKASVRFQLAAEDMWRTADHISEWERELRD